MKTVAITGSIGMGKSTVAAMFERAGVPVFDADAEVRAMQAPGGSLVKAIVEAFPAAADNEGLDREALAAEVLADPAKLTALERIVHPAVERARQDFVARHRGCPILAFDIPLLFESGKEAGYDAVVVVSAPVEMQRARVLKRTNMSEAKLAAILERQMPDATKRARADFVVDTSGSLDATEAQVRHILACLGIAQDS